MATQRGFKSPKLYIYAQIVSRIPCRHFVLCKVASKIKHFIHADIIVLVSEFLLVVVRAHP